MTSDLLLHSWGRPPEHLSKPDFFFLLKKNMKPYLDVDLDSSVDPGVERSPCYPEAGSLI